MSPRAGPREAVLAALAVSVAAATFGDTPRAGRDARRAPAAEVTTLHDGEGRDLTLGRCVVCHSVEYIPANAPAMNRAGWQKSIEKMRDRFGAPITDEEAKQILDYLAAHYSDKSG